MEKDKEKFKILFVCTGNSCRSPMAEGILKKMLRESKLDNFEVFSAGTYNMNGAPPSLFAIEVAKTRNVDLSQHRSRQLNRQILREADLILAMSDAHLEAIRRMDEKALEKTYLLKTFPSRQRRDFQPPANAGDFQQDRLTSDEDNSQSVWYVKDPIGGSMDDYNLCFSEIEKELRRIFPKLKRIASEKNSKDHP
jgi:protein-tyrosine-phosphatase